MCPDFFEPGDMGEKFKTAVDKNFSTGLI